MDCEYLRAEEDRLIADLDGGSYLARRKTRPAPFRAAKTAIRVLREVIKLLCGWRKKFARAKNRLACGHC
jgi:hypothetical protein